MSTLAGSRLTIADLKTPPRLEALVEPPAPAPPPAAKPKQAAPAKPQPAKAKAPPPAPKLPKVKSEAYIARKRRNRDKRLAGVADIPRADVEALRNRLVATFPAFQASPRKPLKIGIDDDILAAMPDVPKPLLAAAMDSWVGWTPYVKALAKGGDRYALDGTPAGSITPEQQEHARMRMERRRKRWDEAREKRNAETTTAKL